MRWREKKKKKKKGIKKFSSGMVANLSFGDDPRFELNYSYGGLQTPGM